MTGAESEASPPQKTWAIEEVCEETFASQDTDKMFANSIKDEVESYKAASSVTVDQNPLDWWKSNVCVNTLTLP